MRIFPLLAALSLAGLASLPAAEPLRAGVARTDITDRESGPVHDSLFAKALVLTDGVARTALITVDAVALGEIGRIPRTFLPAVRAALEKDPGIPGANVLINASHCHGVVRRDVEALVVQTVREAWRQAAPVTVSVASSREEGISENRRLRLQDGSEVDMRRAYAGPADEQIASVGPIDPQIGILRLDRSNGDPLAVVYQFACHPIMNPPEMGNSADYPGVASRVIEQTLGRGCVALFVQGCAGDINPRGYKDARRPPDAGPLGNRLAIAVLAALREAGPDASTRLGVVNRTVALPRGADLERRMAALQARQAQLLQSFRPTPLQFRSFLPLYLEQRLWPAHPSQPAQAYLHGQATGDGDLSRTDASNRLAVDHYLQNLQIMEELTRLHTNLGLLRMHHKQNQDAGAPTVAAEISGLRVGSFKLVAFPGELTVEIGLNLKKAFQDPHAFVAGYTNGYLYYLPTVSQRNNRGYAQEDCDCIVAPEWQSVFESAALEVHRQLAAP